MESCSIKIQIQVNLILELSFIIIDEIFSPLQSCVIIPFVAHEISLVTSIKKKKRNRMKMGENIA